MAHDPLSEEQASMSFATFNLQHDILLSISPIKER